MRIDRSAPRADRCANCNAFLPAAKDSATHKRCTYCGVEVDLPPPSLEPELPQTAPPSSGSAPDVRSWLPWVAPLAIVGSIFFWTQRSREPGRTSFPRPLPPPSLEPASARDPLSQPERPAVATPVPPSESRKRHRTPDSAEGRHSEPCHVSGMQLSAIVEANQARARRCFASDLARFPTDVGLTSNWAVEVDGAGQVHAAHGRLHLLDYKRPAEERERTKVEPPAAAAISCAEDAIRAWVFPAYSPKDGARMRMKCSFNFVIKDL